MSFRIVLLLIGASLTVAAAPPGIPATTLRPDDLRVASIGYRLALKGMPYCPEPYPITGLLLHHLAEYEGDGRAFEITHHALERGPGVLATVADSPAALAGLMAGDTLLTLNGEPFPDSRINPVNRTDKDWRASIEASEARLEGALRHGPVTLTVFRAGVIVGVRLEPGKGCPARVRLARSNQANAFATGTYVVLTTRMLSALQSDDELAIILGHELAHNVLNHRRDVEGKRPSLNRAAEEAADRLGLRLAAAAGYDVHAAVPMWRRLYKRFGSGLQLVRTHPTLKARERVIEEVIAQLDQERSTSLAR